MEISPATPLDELLGEARRIRDHRHGTRVTYSPKVFIPLTMLCRDHCGYCTFAKPPARLGASPYLGPEQVLEIARAGAAAGCHEALFTLGERPEERYPVAREALAGLGQGSTVDYLAESCRLVLAETGLLPHANAGALLRWRAGRAAPGLGQPGDDAGVAVGAAARAGRPPRPLPDQAAGPPAGHPGGGRGAGHPVHHRDPGRDRRDPGRAAGGAGRHRRRPPPPRPRPGGDRPELPPQAGHGHGRRRAAVPGGLPVDDRGRPGPARPRHPPPGPAQPHRGLRGPAGGGDRRLGRGLARSPPTTSTPRRPGRPWSACAR